VRFHADAEQVVGFEHVEGLLFGQSHSDSFRLFILTEERSVWKFEAIEIRGALGKYEG